jgi:hypothetical protein
MKILLLVLAMTACGYDERSRPATVTLQECAKDKEPLEDQKEEKDCALKALLEAENEK